MTWVALCHLSLCVIGGRPCLDHARTVSGIAASRKAPPFLGFPGLVYGVV